MAGYGIKSFLIAQSLNQIEKAYGQNQSIFDNYHVLRQLPCANLRADALRPKLISNEVDASLIKDISLSSPMGMEPPRNRREADSSCCVE